MRYFDGKRGLALRAVVLTALCLGGCQQGGGGSNGVSGRCVRLSPGEGTGVSLFDSGIVTAYRLERASASAWKATISLRFVPADASVDAKAAALMSEVTSRCLSAAAAAMKGPSGETLEVALAAPGTLEVPTIEIGVTDLPARGHARLWHRRWSCPQILHEVFHVLGLVDEYREPGVKWNCRAMGPPSSLMAEPFSAFAAVHGGERESLLFPAQFRVVTSPGCADSAGTYYGCAANAYRTATVEGCFPAPAECQGGKLDWIVR